MVSEKKDDDNNIVNLLMAMLSFILEVTFFWVFFLEDKPDDCLSVHHQDTTSLTRRQFESNNIRTSLNSRPVNETTSLLLSTVSNTPSCSQSVSKDLRQIKMTARFDDKQFMQQIPQSTSISSLTQSSPDLDPQGDAGLKSTLPPVSFKDSVVTSGGVANPHTLIRSNSLTNKAESRTGAAVMLAGQRIVDDHDDIGDLSNILLDESYLNVDSIPPELVDDLDTISEEGDYLRESRDFGLPSLEANNNNNNNNNINSRKSSFQLQP